MRNKQMNKKFGFSTLIPNILTTVVFLLTHGNLSAQINWPQFRGIEARGISSEANLPSKWSATENIAWKFDIPGRGWSSPIVWGDHIFLTSVINSGTTEDPKKGLYFGGNGQNHQLLLINIKFTASIYTLAKLSGNDLLMKASLKHPFTLKAAMLLKHL
ncbi:MAG: hypothetical protein EBQ87_04360 [Planctomycetes bacterium]|nr:hypothetical protein [Planctomycetota bacterium]